MRKKLLQRVKKGQYLYVTDEIQLYVLYDAAYTPYPWRLFRGNPLQLVDAYQKLEHAENEVQRIVKGLK